MTVAYYYTHEEKRQCPICAGIGCRSCQYAGFFLINLINPAYLTLADILLEYPSLYYLSIQADLADVIAVRSSQGSYRE